MNTKYYIFDRLPETKEEFTPLTEAKLQSPFDCVALTLLALLHYEKNAAFSLELLNVLKGPSPLSEYEKQFIRERLNNKGYKVRSFFEGSAPENNYQPNVPYSLCVYETPYSYPQEHWATLYVKSSGADQLRSIKLRCKPSTGQWFLNEIQCLSDIRLPQESDPWA